MFGIVAYVLMVVWLILLYLDYKKENRENSDSLCHTSEFWFQDAVLLGVMLGFIYAAKVISNIINEEIDASKLVENQEIDTMFSRIVTDSRKTSMKQMWLVCLTLTFCAFYDTLYTLSVFFFSGQQCEP